MSKGLEELEKIELKWQYGIFTFIPNFESIEKELTLLQDLLGHITDLYMKREIDYYADREPFYYDYYIVFDNTPIKVSEQLYGEIKSQLGLEKQLDKCVEW